MDKVKDELRAARDDVRRDEEQGRWTDEFFDEILNAGAQWMGGKRGPVNADHYTSLVNYARSKRDAVIALLDHIDALESGREAVIPCDVKLPPSTIISAGCKLSTLIEAMEHRREAGVVHFETKLPIALAKPKEGC